MSIEEQLLRQPEFTQIPDIETLRRLPDYAVILTKTARLCEVHPTEVRVSAYVESIEFGDDLVGVVGEEDLPALLIFNPDWLRDD